MNTIAGTNEFHSVLFESSRFDPVAVNILADSFPLRNAARPREVLYRVRLLAA